MSTEPISVLVVDDSAMMRNLISRVIDEEPDLRAAGKAMNGQFALQKIPKLKPDVILLDLEMPTLNGIEFLKERLKRRIDIPVVILSSIAKRGAKITMDALALGASDFILKPSESGTENIKIIAKTVLEMVRSYGGKYREERGMNTIAPPERSQEMKKEAPKAIETTQQIEAESKSAPAVPKVKAPKRKTENIEVIAIGISTGGPNALRKMFSTLDPELDVPIVVVQHMPEGFTGEFAKSLDRICPLEVKEAAEGDIVKPGRILIAPGNYHLTLEKKPLSVVTHISDSPAVNGHRPSADVLFESVAEVFKNNAMALIMTGMGRDGAQNIGRVYEEGGITIGQDEASCVVYGMPRIAYEYGFIHKQVSLDDMADTIASYTKEYNTK